MSSVRVLKSTPIVEIKFSLKTLSENLIVRDDFPTGEFPDNNILKTKSSSFYIVIIFNQKYNSVRVINYATIYTDYKRLFLIL
jgi:hypothetical protein